MTALFSFIFSKDGIYTAALLAIGLFLWHYHTLDDDVKAMKAAAAVAQKTVKTDQSTAQNTETQNALIYKQAVAIPPIGDIGLVCQHTGGSKVPPSSPTTASGPGQTVDSGVGPSYDPSGAILTRGREADAEIAYWRARAKEDEAEMNAAP
jgi:hypothetical protein